MGKENAIENPISLLQSQQIAADVTLNVNLRLALKQARFPGQTLVRRHPGNRRTNSGPHRAGQLTLIRS